jgi:hypothetical protein
MNDNAVEDHIQINLPNLSPQKLQVKQQFFQANSFNRDFEDEGQGMEIRQAHLGPARPMTSFSPNPLKLGQ